MSILVALALRGSSLSNSAANLRMRFMSSLFSPDSSFLLSIDGTFEIISLSWFRYSDMSQQPQLIVGGYPQQPAYLVTSPVQATYMPHQQYPQQVPYGNNNFYQNNAAYGQPQPAFQPYTDAAGFASPVAVHVSVPVADVLLILSSSMLINRSALMLIPCRTFRSSSW